MGSIRLPDNIGCCAHGTSGTRAEQNACKLAYAGRATHHDFNAKQTCHFGGTRPLG